MRRTACAQGSTEGCRIQLQQVGPQKLLLAELLYSISNNSGNKRMYWFNKFKNTTTFDNSSSQIVGEVIASNYCSNHPSIVVKTDLNKNFDIYRIRKKTIYKAKLSLEEGFKAVAHWLSICSTSPTFDWKTDAHSFDEDLTYPLRFFYDEFKVRIINEFIRYFSYKYKHFFNIF